MKITGNGGPGATTPGMKQTRITRPLVEAYITAVATWDRYLLCLHGRPPDVEEPEYWQRTDGQCPDGRWDRKCPQCEAFRAADRKVDALLKLKPWATSPVAAVHGEPPDWAKNTEWSKAWALRQRIEAVIERTPELQAMREQAVKDAAT